MSAEIRQLASTFNHMVDIIGEATARRNGAPMFSHIRIELRKSGEGAILSNMPLFEALQARASPIATVSIFWRASGGPGPASPAAHSVSTTTEW